MNKQMKRKWVAALRSGEYEQGKGALYPDGKYCCLGVARKVCELDGITHTTLQLSELDVLGIDIDDEHLLANAMNDAGIDFDWIASYIEVML